MIRFFAAILAAGAALALTAGAAAAHPISSTAVLLDVDPAQVTAEIELPVDRLAVAFDEKLDAQSVLQPATLATLQTYVRAHLSATSSGQSWTTTVTGGRVAVVDGVDHLVLEAVLRPSDGRVGEFTLHYDAIIDRIVSHKVFVTARYGDSGPYTTLAMLSWQQQTVPVRSVAPPAGTGFVAAVKLGSSHIRSGSDHLLFLLTLLLPAPLLVRGRRWVRRDDLGRAGWRVVHVVTAFAVGHSITLALGAFGLIDLPTRLIESGIALSVLVSAVHAIRPLLRRGEVVIAGAFGLLHGLSFAAVLSSLGLSRGGLVVELLGFNLGIELTQLLVVALVMPSLFVLSRTRVYPWVRLGGGGVAVVLAGAWLAERTTLLTTNPLAPVGEALVNHPLPLVVGLAVLAAVARAVASHPADAVGVGSPITEAGSGSVPGRDGAPGSRRRIPA